MSENTNPTRHTSLASSVLTESMRQQYLEAMGIQTWYDPALEFEAYNTSAPADVIESMIDESGPLVEQDLQPLPDTDETPTRSSLTDRISDLNAAIEQCQLCELHTYRRQVMAGEGSTTAKLMVITDAPVDDSNAGDVLFKARDKQMLMAMLKAINIDLASVYLTSLVKCQPPQQRAPYTSEMICCDDHLSTQIKLIQPEVMLVLGELASQQLLVSQKCLSDLRLRQHQHLGIPVFVSYHPAELFNSAENKSKVWQDLLQISKAIPV